LIFRLLPIFLIVSLFKFAVDSDSDLTIDERLIIFAYFWTFILTTIFVLFFLKSLIWTYPVRTYKKRTYFLNNFGFEVSKGNSKKFFKWTDFESYYEYCVIRDDKNNTKFRGSRTISKKGRESFIKGLDNLDKKNGKIYYLKKKRSGIFGRLRKVFVLIYAESNNYKAVEKYISHYLPKKEMTAMTDMGMVFLKYK